MTKPVPIRLRPPRRFMGAAGLASALALIVGSARAVAQCSLCRDAVAASSPETREAMNYAIIGLAFAPFGVAALAAWTLSPGVRALVAGRLGRLPFRRSPEGPS